MAAKADTGEPATKGAGDCVGRHGSAGSKRRLPLGFQRSEVLLPRLALSGIKSNPFGMDCAPELRGEGARPQAYSAIELGLVVPLRNLVVRKQQSRRGRAHSWFLAPRRRCCRCHVSVRSGDVATHDLPVAQQHLAVRSVCRGASE